MNIVKDNLKRVVFFITISFLYISLFMKNFIVVVAKDGVASENAEVYKKIPYIAKYIIQWNFILVAFGMAFWYLALGLVYLLNGVYAGITGIFDVIGSLFSDSTIVQYFAQYNGFIFPIMLVTLSIYCVYTILFGSKKMKGLGKGITVVLMSLIFSSSIIGMMAQTTSDIASVIQVNDQNCEKLSFGTCLFKNYIVDVPYYASQQNENGEKNKIRTDYDFSVIDYSEGIGLMQFGTNSGVDNIDSSYKNSVGDLHIPRVYDENGNVKAALGLKNGDWWKLGANYVSYQRYIVNFIGFFLTAGVVLFALLGSGFRMGVFVFDGTLISGLMLLISSGDVGTGKRTSNALKIIGVGLLNLLLYMVAIKYFGVYVLAVQKTNAHWLSQVFMISGGAVAVYNLPQTLAKIFMIEAPRDGQMLQKMFYADRLSKSFSGKMGAVKNGVKGGVNKTSDVVTGFVDTIDGGVMSQKYEQRQQQFKKNMGNVKNRNRTDKLQEVGNEKIEDQNAMRSSIVENRIKENSNFEKNADYLKYYDEFKDNPNFFNTDKKSLDDFKSKEVSRQNVIETGRDLMNRPIYGKKEDKDNKMMNRGGYNESLFSKGAVNKKQNNSMSQRTYNQNFDKKPHQEMVDFDSMPQKPPLTDKELEKFLNDYGDVLDLE